MPYSLFTCLPFFLLVLNLCYSFSPNDWASSSGWEDSSPPYGFGSGSGFGSPPVPQFGSPPGPQYSWPSGPTFGSPPSSGSGSGSSTPPGPQFGSPPSSGSGSGSSTPPNYGSPPAADSGGWVSSRATWYGDPDGDGSHGGGNCGYAAAIDSYPFAGIVTSVNAALFQDGQGCGNCFQIKCSSPHCSQQPVTVVVADSSLDIPHAFDLSNLAFKKLANKGEEELLQQPVDILYRQVPCNYNGVKVAFTVQQSSNPYYLAVAVEYVNGEALTKVEIKGLNGQWVTMARSWGAVWAANLNGVSPPFSFTLTQNSGSLVAENVIPPNYQKIKYTSMVNF